MSGQLDRLVNENRGFDEECDRLRQQLSHMTQERYELTEALNSHNLHLSSPPGQAADEQSSGGGESWTRQEM